MSAGLISRADLTAILKDPRLVRTFDQMQQLVFNSNLDTLTTLNFANDAAAKAGGVAIGSLYHNAGVVRVRLT